MRLPQYFEVLVRKYNLRGVVHKEYEVFRRENQGWYERTFRTTRSDIDFCPNCGKYLSEYDVYVAQHRVTCEAKMVPTSVIYRVLKNNPVIAKSPVLVLDGRAVGKYTENMLVPPKRIWVPALLS